MSNHDRETISITLTHRDGTTETLDRGLVAFMTDAETIILQVCDLTGPELITILAGFQGAISHKEDEHGQV